MIEAIKYKNEIWKTHPEHPKYLFSNYGRVMGVKTKVIRTVRPNKKGYITVDLFENGKLIKYTVHRLIAQVFVHNPNPNIYTQVNHKDEDKYNNKADNLEWVTPKQNANYGTRNERVSNILSKGRIIKYNDKGEVIEIFNSLREARRKDGSWLHFIINACKGGYYKGYFYYREDVSFHKL